MLHRLQYSFSVGYDSEYYITLDTQIDTYIYMHSAVNRIKMGSHSLMTLIA
jgi:hypothetical protein